MTSLLSPILTSLEMLCLCSHGLGAWAVGGRKGSPSGRYYKDSESLNKHLPLMRCSPSLKVVCPSVVEDTAAPGSHLPRLQGKHKRPSFLSRPIGGWIDAALPQVGS
jgi:hypothetical protein